MGKLDKLFGGGGGGDSTTASNLGVRGEGHEVATLPAEAQDPKLRATKRDMSAKVILLSRIMAKKQVREDFDEEALKELAHSLKTIGQTQPCLVYWSEADDRYVIIAGERRFRAAKMAGLKSLDCKVHPNEPDEAELVELQFVENAIRTDLNPIEEAKSYGRLKELKGYSAVQLAERIGKHHSTVSRSLQLLGLPGEIQTQVAAGQIPMSVAREIVKLKDDDAQHEMANQYLAGELTTTQAQQTTNKKAGKNRAAATRSKKFTHKGLAVSAALKRGQTNADLINTLEAWLQKLRSDGRSMARAA